ncbi:MAG: prolyl oligopeptidase family serine peptidase [Actinobacteria bacterium]|nr:prolyl oligopeptidase family serine peptidase [Actinomycetota bacterium]
MTAAPSPSELPFGTWPSPITTASLTASEARLDDVAVDGADTYWIEGRPWEGGRCVLVRHDGATGATVDVTPAPWNVRSRVHEYGGGPYAVRDGLVVFSDFADGRLRRLDPGSSEPVAITPEGAVRFGGLVLQGDHVYAVREDHRLGGEPRNELVRLDIRGENPDFGQVLATGTDFVSRPAVSDDGSRIAWISWDHPNMPWDSTVLRQARLTESGCTDEQIVTGGPDVSVSQPIYDADGRLWFFSDETNWWNPWVWDEGVVRQVLDVAADLASPQWVLGKRDIAMLADGRAVLRDPSGQGLMVVDHRGARTQLALGATGTNQVCATGARIALERGSADRLPDIVTIDLATGRTDVLATSSPTAPNPADVSRAEKVSWTNGAGLTAYGNFYPPANARVTGPADQAPPLLVLVHGGPTAQAERSFQTGIQFWTTRGFAVLDVDYGGSTGYGREYRERLREQWGVVDIDDCVTGAAAMAREGRVDGARLAIRGGSAGGYTVMRALTTSTVFAAGTSYYGISDLAALVADDHKFESQYTFGLIGPWPDETGVYADRSPIHHIEDLHGDLLLLQGTDDLAVPLAQAQGMADAMLAAGKDVELVVYPGEGHGFRAAATIEDAYTRELAHYQRVFGLLG